MDLVHKLGLPYKNLDNYFKKCKTHTPHIHEGQTDSVYTPFVK